MHPINLHHKDDIYYLFLAVILMHNMMVEARIENDEVECANLHNTFSATESESSSEVINDTTVMVVDGSTEQPIGALSKT